VVSVRSICAATVSMEVGFKACVPVPMSARNAKNTVWHRFPVQAVDFTVNSIPSVQFVAYRVLR
jgi:hypothetical protein